MPIQHIAISDLLNINPGEYVPPQQGKTYSIGDTHGNAIVFVRYLFEAGIIKIDDHEYQELLKIYQKESSGHDSRLTRQDLKDFNSIIANGFSRVLEIQSIHNFKLRLFGDTLADRGANDILTLMIFDQMRERFPSIERTILFSNHDKCFLRNFYNGRLEETGNQNLIIELNPCSSMIRLKSLLEMGNVSDTDISQYVHHSYIPNLKLLDYKITEENEIDIMTHAPFTLPALDTAMRQMLPDTDHCDIYASVRNVTKVIDALNLVFTQNLKNRSGPVYNAIVAAPSEKNILQTFIWPRLVDIRRMNHTQKSKYSVRFRHGHDGTPGINNIEGIDYIGYNNELGKSSPAQWQRAQEAICTLSHRSLTGMESSIEQILKSEATTEISSSDGDKSTSITMALRIGTAIREIFEAERDSTTMPVEAKASATSSNNQSHLDSGTEREDHQGIELTKALLSFKLIMVLELNHYIEIHEGYTKTVTEDELWTAAATLYNASVNRFFPRFTIDLPLAAEAKRLRNLVLSINANNLEKNISSITGILLYGHETLDSKNTFKSLIIDLRKTAAKLIPKPPSENAMHSIRN